MTGRAAGYCAGFPVPGYANQIPGRGYGYGPGRGLGLGFRGGRGGRWGGAYIGYNPAYSYAPPYPSEITGQQEMESLKNQAEYLASTLEDINKRITELESEKSKK
jgi:hypothetical protein